MREKTQEGGEERPPFCMFCAARLELLDLVTRWVMTENQSVQVLKARVLLSFPDSPRQKQGRDDISTLLQRDPPIADVQAVIILEECLRQIEATDAEIDLIWERAVRLRPQDEELQTLWFKKNFEQRIWKGAQKVGRVAYFPALLFMLRQAMKGINVFTEELSEDETILFLGDRRQLHGRKYSYSIGHGPTTLRRVSIQAAF